MMIYNLRVSELLDPLSREWDKEKVESVFLPADAKRILRIPLSKRPAMDRLFWLHTRNGEYKVRSGYHLERDRTRGVSATTRDDNEGRKKKLWRALWNANVPNKVKVFCWRACQEILPVFSNLVRRQISVPSECPRCQKECETTPHALRDCDFAKEVWQHTPYNQAWIAPHDTGTLDWWCNALEKADDESFSNGMMLQWAIWNARNDTVKSNAVKNAVHIARQAASIL
ncbi:hypothetical protein PTKIN_Ptkin10aG0141600 [Pterospermum kingtungense]